MTARFLALCAAALLLASGCGQGGQSGGTSIPVPSRSATSGSASPSRSVATASASVPASVGGTADAEPLVPAGWTSATIATVPQTWHVAGQPSNAFEDGISPGPYTYVSLDAKVAARLADEINASPVDTLLPRSCPIGRAYGYLAFRYPRSTVTVLLDPNCNDASRQDGRGRLRTLSPSVQQEVAAAVPGFGVAASP